MGSLKTIFILDQVVLKNGFSINLLTYQFIASVGIERCIFLFWFWIGGFAKC